MNIKNFYKPAPKSALALTIILAACASTKVDMPMAKGTASQALIVLATTGDPVPLRKEIGGQIISSAKLQKRAGPVLDLAKKEHLAPKALVTKDNRIFAMVAPTITKDNFIFVGKDNKLLRMDVGFTEGHKKPFVVTEIVEDGGASYFAQFGHWLRGLFSGE